jgi:PAS domain S-box-containing protein
VVDTIAGQAVQPGESLRLSQVTAGQLRAFVPERLWPLLERFPIYSVLAVPLRVRDQRLGVLVLTRGRPEEPYTEADQAFLESLADHAALAIDNARSFEAEQAARRATQLAADRSARLLAVTAALTSPVSARAVAEVLTQQSAAALGASASSLYLLDEGGAWLTMVASVGFPEAVRQAVSRLPLAGSMPAADVFRDQQPQWLRSNDELVEHYPHLAAARGVTRNEAVAILPLSSPDLALGILSVSFAQVHEFSAEERDFLRTLAGLGTHALERARLYDAEQQAHAEARSAQARLAFLAATSAALTESLNDQATLQTLARQMVPYLADWCLVDLLGSGGELQQVAVAHVQPEREALIRQLRHVYPPTTEATHPIYRVIDTKQSLLAPVITREELAARAVNAEHLGWLQTLDICSHIVVPLVAREQALGALSLVRTSASPAYTPVDLALAEEVARRAAQAIDNARLYADAQSLNAFLEDRVRERTRDLATALDSARQANQDLAREVAVRARAEQRFRHLLENAPDATVIVNAAGRIVLANSQVERLFGYRPEALLGQPVEKLVPERFWERHRAHRLGYVEQPRSRPMGAGLELYGRRQDGTEFPIEVSLGPLQADEGLLITCVLRDITRRKQIADELRASHEQLQALMTRVQTVREEERANLAREVHDELGQQLSGLKMDVAWLRKRLAPEQTELLEKLASTSQLLDQTIKTVRQIATELRPGLLDDFGLLAAIDWQLREFGERSGLATTFEAALEELPLPPETATAVYRVFQESLTNIARHAHASLVTVSAQTHGDDFLLEIRDDGQGFDPDAAGRPRSLGLAGMHERVQAFHGRLEIDSQPGQGTAIRVFVPSKGA